MPPETERHIHCLRNQEGDESQCVPLSEAVGNALCAEARKDRTRATNPLSAPLWAMTGRPQVRPVRPVGRCHGKGAPQSPC